MIGGLPRGPEHVRPVMACPPLGGRNEKWWNGNESAQLFRSGRFRPTATQHFAFCPCFPRVMYKEVLSSLQEPDICNPRKKGRCCCHWLAFLSVSECQPFIVNARPLKIDLGYVKSQENGMSRMTRLSRPAAMQTVAVVGSFYNHANFGAVTKPQSTFVRRSYRSLPLPPQPQRR